MRRCNLACAYCNEYDTVSSPVPLPLMRGRIGHLARLGTALVTISGGEPLMHPELDEIIAAIRGAGMAATLISNGYYLSPDRIRRLNRAGLDHLQANSRGPKFIRQTCQRVRALQVHVRRGRKVYDDQLRMRRLPERLFRNCVSYVVYVEINQARLRPEDQDTGDQFVVRMALAIGETARAWDASKKCHVRPRGAAQQLDERNKSADHDAAQQA